MIKKIRLCALSAALLLSAMLLSSCATRVQQSDLQEPLISIKDAVTIADPQAAVDAIYESLPDSISTPITSTVLRDEIGINPDDINAFFGRTTSPAGYLSDVVIILADPAKRDDIISSLGAYQDKKVREYENYDILDAHSIAKSAMIYDQGGYVILLMLSDNRAGQNIIDQYIPQ